MKPIDVVQAVLQERIHNTPKAAGVAFAPVNIALCKYWGKRNAEINLPMTSSLSISLGDKGSHTTIKVISDKNDHIVLNGQVVDLASDFAKRLIAYLDLFRPDLNHHFEITIEANIPIAAGLASSAAGFASVIQALNQLFDWQLTPKDLSILARLGSGSASRSLWNGFVKWHRGEQADGMDSFAEPLNSQWPDLGIGLMLFSTAQKSIGSRQAMDRTVKTSKLYASWPDQVQQDMMQLEKAIDLRDFHLLGQTAESNALAMHATMLSSWPPVLYALPETVSMMHQIWALRDAGLSVYFTQDAGPNLKLLFLMSEMEKIQAAFPEIEIVPLRF